MQLEPSRRPANRHRLKGCRFNQQINRRFGNLTVRATHDPTERQGGLAIPDDDHLRVKHITSMIDRFEILFLSRRSNHDPIRGNAIQIKSMQRLPALHHHIVGRIDDIVDRSNPNRSQSLSKPLRTRTDLDPAYHPRGVPRTSLRKKILDLKQLMHRLLARGQIHRRYLQRLRIQNGRFARDANMPQTVCAVARDLQIDHRDPFDPLSALMVEPR